MEYRLIKPALFILTLLAWLLTGAPAHAGRVSDGGGHGVLFKTREKLTYKMIEGFYKPVDQIPGIAEARTQLAQIRALFPALADVLERRLNSLRWHEVPATVDFVSAKRAGLHFDEQEGCYQIAEKYNPNVHLGAGQDDLEVFCDADLRSKMAPADAGQTIIHETLMGLDRVNKDSQPTRAVVEWLSVANPDTLRIQNELARIGLGTYYTKEQLNLFSSLLRHQYLIDLSELLTTAGQSCNDARQPLTTIRDVLVNPSSARNGAAHDASFSIGRLSWYSPFRPALLDLGLGKSAAEFSMGALDFYFAQNYPSRQGFLVHVASYAKIDTNDPNYDITVGAMIAAERSVLSGARLRDVKLSLSQSDDFMSLIALSLGNQKTAAEAWGRPDDIHPPFIGQPKGPGFDILKNVIDLRNRLHPEALPEAELRRQICDHVQRLQPAVAKMAESEKLPPTEFWERNED